MMLKANTAIQASKKSKDINPVLITLILSIIISGPQAIFTQLYYYYLLFVKNLEAGEAKRLGLELVSSKSYIFLLLYLTTISLLLAYVFSRKILKRSKESLGLVDKSKFKKYGLGILIGIISVAIIIGILYILGHARLSLNISNISPLPLIIIIIGWIIQGFEEEFILRSILMNQFAQRGRIEMAIFANSLIFAILHLGNHGFNGLALINLFLLGLFLSLLFYLTDSIYLPAAVHSFWNMSQANIFGISVSGTSQLTNTILKTELLGEKFLTGANFGIEASLITSLILLIGICYLYKKTKK